MGQTCNLHVDTRASSLLASSLSCYVFQNGTLSSVASGLTSPFKLTAPVGAQVFAFSGDVIPEGLLAVEAGKTTLQEFLAIHTDKDHPPFEFYTGSFVRVAGINDYTIPFTIGQARIDLDATSSDQLSITKVKVNNTPASALLFAGEQLKQAFPKREISSDFTAAPIMGFKEDILRLYESDEQLNVTVEGSYVNIPFTCEAVLPKVKRNHKYTLRIKNAGVKIEAVINYEIWQQTETVDASPNLDQKLLIDSEHSVFPDGTVVADSRQELTVPHTGGDLILAFVGESAVDFESIVDKLSNLQVSLPGEVKRVADKIVTRYHIHVKGQGDNTLPYNTELHVKSVFRQHSTDRILLTVDSPPLYIREVTLGGKTWMAFNARSRDMDDQVYPMNGYDVEKMYDNEWISTIGGLFQYGRSYMYVPWQAGVNNQGNQLTELPWTEAANTPCPKGYKVPTSDELKALLGKGLSSIPGTWDYNGEQITATEVTAGKSQIDVNAVGGSPKYLRLVGSKGGVMHIPYGGMKSHINPSPKDPLFGQGFRLWASDAPKGGEAICVHCGNLTDYDTERKSIAFMPVNKEAYSYVRCIKE